MKPPTVLPDLSSPICPIFPHRHARPDRASICHTGLDPVRSVSLSNHRTTPPPAGPSTSSGTTRPHHDYDKGPSPFPCHSRRASARRENLFPPRREFLQRESGAIWVGGRWRARGPLSAIFEMAPKRPHPSLTCPAPSPPSLALQISPPLSTSSRALRPSHPLSPPIFRRPSHCHSEEGASPT